MKIASLIGLAALALCSVFLAGALFEGERRASAAALTFAALCIFAAARLAI